MNIKAKNKKKVSVRNASELLKNAYDTLDALRTGGAGGNAAKYPIVIIFMGKNTVEFLQDVKQPLDDNWLNAPQLEYLHLEKTADGFSCKSLVRNEDDILDVKWSEESISFDKAMSDAVVRMLGSEDRSFSESDGGVKFDFILDATDDDALDLYRLYRDYELSMAITQFKTLYFMIDQTPSEITKSETMLQKVIHDDEVKSERVGDSRNIYLISNMQKNNDMLLKGKGLWKNYRLIANIIILGGNRGSNTESNIALSAGIKTAAYAIIPKPISDISKVLVDEIIGQTYEMEKKRFADIITVEDFAKRIGLADDGTMGMAEALFSDVILGDIRQVKPLYEYVPYIKLDNVYQSDGVNKLNSAARMLDYLPYRDVNSLKEIKKNGIQSIALIDRETYGAASAYIQCNFKRQIEEFFAAEGRKEQIVAELMEALLKIFNYFEFKHLEEYRQDIIDRIERNLFIQATGNRDANAAFKNIVKTEAQIFFYEKYKKCLVDAFKRLLDLSDEYTEMYQNIHRDVANLRSPDEDSSIREYYGGRVRSYIDIQQTNHREGVAFSKIFDVRNNKQQLLGAFYEMFDEYVSEDKFFRSNFEEEFQKRYSDLSPGEQIKAVSEGLIKQITGSMRLKNIIEINASKLATYYLVNANAEYAKRLREDKGYSEGKYILYNLNRTDCIEQLEIYKIEDVDYIHLVKNSDMTM